jgi:hypothetical protein
LIPEVHDTHAVVDVTLPHVKLKVASILDAVENVLDLSTVPDRAWMHAVTTPDALLPFSPLAHTVSISESAFNSFKSFYTHGTFGGNEFESIWAMYGNGSRVDVTSGLAAWAQSLVKSER